MNGPLDILAAILTIWWALSTAIFGPLLTMIFMIIMGFVASTVYTDTRKVMGFGESLMWAIAVWLYPPLVAFWYYALPYQIEKREMAGVPLHFRADLPAPVARPAYQEVRFTTPLSELPATVDPLNDDPVEQAQAAQRRSRRKAGERIKTGTRLEPDEIMLDPWQHLGAATALPGGLPPEVEGPRNPRPVVIPEPPKFAGVEIPEVTALFNEGRYAEAVDLLDHRIQQAREDSMPTTELERYMAFVRTYQIHDELRSYRVAKNTGHFLQTPQP